MKKGPFGSITNSLLFFSQIIVISLILLLGGGHQSFATILPKIIVGVPPYAYLVERIGGKYIDVQVLLGAGQDPHTFEPRPKKVMSLGGSRVLFSAGMEFEEHLIARIQDNFKGMKVVDLSEGIPPETSESVHDHDHDHDHDHGHDPHIWLSPTILISQVGEIAKTLEEIDPAHGAVYRHNLFELQTELRQVRARIANMLAPFRGRSFLVYHPAFAYFGKDFGLHQVGVEANGGKPSPKQLATLLAQARREDVKIVFVQPQFDQKNAEVLAASIGGAVVPMDPLARNVIQNFSRMAEKLEKAFQ